MAHGPGDSIKLPVPNHYSLFMGEQVILLVGSILKREMLKDQNDTGNTYQLSYFTIC